MAASLGEDKKKRVTPTASEWRAIKRIHGNKCVVCERTEKEVGILEKAHIKAHSKGGTQVIPMCPNHHTKFDNLLLNRGEVKKLGLEWDKYKRGFYAYKKSKTRDRDDLKKGTHLVKRRNRSSIRYLPELLYQMDEKMKQLIQTAIVPERSKMEKFAKDVGEMYGIDAEKLQEVMGFDDQAQIRKLLDIKAEHMAASYREQPLGKTFESLIKLKGIMDSYGIGLESIKDSEYKILERQLEVLKIRIRNADSTKKLNNYILWRDGFRSLALYFRYNSEVTISPEILPPTFKAAKGVINTVIDLFLGNLLAEIKESIFNSNSDKK